MTARYLGRAFFFRKGHIVRLKIGLYGSANYRTFNEGDADFFEAVVNELEFFAQNTEERCAKPFFRNLAVNLSETSQFFESSREIAAENNIPL